MQSTGYGELALGYARAHRFVDHCGFESEGNWVGFVGAGVVKLAIDHDGDWDQMRLTVWSKLYQSRCSGALDFRLAGCLRVSDLQRDQSESEADDGLPQPAV